MTPSPEQPVPQFAGDALRDSPWQSRVARPLLIAVQATCLTVGLWVIVQIIGDFPGLQAAPLLAFIAALVGVYTAQWLALPAQRLTARTPFVLAELLVMLVVLRLLTWALSGNWPTLAAARGWILEPWTFFDGVFVVASLLCALAWHRAMVVADIFGQLALTPGELAYEGERRSNSIWRAGRHAERALVSRTDLVGDYVSQWLLGGMFLAFCAAATRVRVGPGLSINVLSMGIPAPIVVACVVYFLIGLVLTSQARLAMLRAQWLQDGVEMPERLPGRWSRFSLLIILIIGLLAALLPLGSTWQIGAIVNAVAMFFVQIALYIVFLFTLLFALIARLFNETQPLPEPPVAPAPMAPAPMVPIVQPPEWLGGAGLWLAVIVAILLALRLLLGKDGLDVTRRKLAALLDRLRATVAAWLHGVRSLAESVQLSLPGRRSLPHAQPPKPPWRFVRLGGLSPREQVRYFYLSTVRRAADQGVARQPAQTPAEFVHDLERTWPEADVDVEALTEAFVTARYDVAEISSGEAREVKTIWERIKRALRGQRSASTGDSVE